MGIATCFALAWCFGHLFNKTFKHMLNDMHGNSSLTISSFQSIINSTSLWTQTVGLCPLMPTHWNHPSCQPGHSWCQHLAWRTCLIVRMQKVEQSHLNSEEMLVVGLQEKETSLFDRWLLDAFDLKRNSWTSRWAQNNHTETAQGHQANTFMQWLNDPC